MTGKILLADDSITIQKVVNLTFADEGIEVVAVSNGEMAERRLSEIDPDVVLADIFMPGKNGYELCESIKQHPQYRNLPVILLVGAFEPFDQAEARRVRADAHLTKPFESRTLVETVRKLMERSGKPRTGGLPSQPLNEAEQARRFATNPLPPPDIDLAAMSQPVAAAEAAAPPAPLDQSTPLDFDYTAGNDAAPIEVEFEAPAGFDSPLPQINSTSELSAFGLPDPLAGEAADAAPAQVLTFADSSNIPSAFGDQAELAVGFDDADATETPGEEVRMTFEVNTPEPAEAAPAQNFEIAEEAAGDYSFTYTEWGTGEPAAPVEEAATGLEIGEAGDSAAPADLLGDSPLGDVLGDDLVQENYASTVGAPPEDMFDLSAAPTGMASEAEPFAADGAAAPDYQPVFSVAENMLKETPVSPQAADALPVEEAETGFAFAGEEAALTFGAEPAEAAETTFSTSEMWAREEARFTPIDIEAVPMDEADAEPAPAIEEAPAAAVETPAAETPTGFDFALVTETAVDEAPAEVTPGPIPAPELVAEPVPAAEAQSPAPGGAQGDAWKEIELSPAVLDEIVRRVVAELSDRVVREVAWEVVPDIVERVIEKLARESLARKF